ncbi:MAG: radical SAM protein [Deltaproteobacteria bacterium]|nr:radical SAM protein [Deltaproteobacteria bacterium]MCW5801799.1 radical SAM protein [Deltaproteobacteria bacterium]
MRYVGKLYRPPSEADALILQATIGCSWNHCTYCDMYRDKPDFRVRPLAESLEDLAHAGRELGPAVEKVFVADGDALVMDLAHWEPILDACRRLFPNLRRISCYATAVNVLAKSDADLRRLRELGLSLLYMGPESGDDATLRRIAKGSTAADHVEAARRARAAGLELSAIFLLGAGGVERSAEHARGSAALATAMDPHYLAALTLTVVPATPLATLAERGKFALPSVADLLGELRTFVDEARPTDALFRTNHASNYLPLGGRLPRDRARIVDVIDGALAGAVPLRPEHRRGL